MFANYLLVFLFYCCSFLLTEVSKSCWPRKNQFDHLQHRSWHFIISKPIVNCCDVIVNCDMDWLMVEIFMNHAIDWLLRSNTSWILPSIGCMLNTSWILPLIGCLIYSLWILPSIGWCLKLLQSSIQNGDGVVTNCNTTVPFLEL